MIDKILEYQKRDFEIIKLERQLENNEDKKIYQNMIGIVKDAQKKSTSLDKEANSLLQEYKSLQNAYNDNLKSCGVILNKNLDKINIDDLDSVSKEVYEAGDALVGYIRISAFASNTAAQFKDALVELEKENIFYY